MGDSRESHRRISAWMLIVLILCFSACYKAPPYPEALEEVVNDSAESERLLSTLLSRSADVRSFRALSRSLMVKDEDKIRVRHALVFESPGKMRIETLPPIAAYTLTLLLADANKACYLDVQNRWAACADEAGKLLEQSLGIVLPVEDAKALLSGRIPTRIANEMRDAGGVEISRDRTGSLVAFRSKSRSGYWQVDSDDWLLRIAHVRDPFRPSAVLIITYDEYDFSSGIPMPKHLTISVPREKFSLKMQFSSINVNGDYSDNLFQAAIPKGYHLYLPSNAQDRSQ